MSFDFFICEPLRAVNRANVCAVSVAAFLPVAMMPPKVNPKIKVLLHSFAVRFGPALTMKSLLAAQFNYRRVRQRDPVNGVI
jgi:hypothetical protein